MLVAISILTTTIQSCKPEAKDLKEVATKTEQAEYFLLRPELKKSYGYSHALE